MFDGLFERDHSDMPLFKSVFLIVIFVLIMCLQALTMKRDILSACSGYAEALGVGE